MGNQGIRIRNSGNQEQEIRNSEREAMPRATPQGMKTEEENENEDEDDSLVRRGKAESWVAESWVAESSGKPRSRSVFSP
jgi:hypothetical protein